MERCHPVLSCRIQLGKIHFTLQSFLCTVSQNVSPTLTYDISLIYGYNVGMEISTGDSSCFAFACTISSGCPTAGPDGSCYSPCCTDAASCAGGALPAGGGGCVDNAGPGPNSPFYYTTCPNAYAFPDNDGQYPHSLYGNNSQLLTPIRRRRVHSG